MRTGQTARWRPKPCLLLSASHPAGPNLEWPQLGPPFAKILELLRMRMMTLYSQVHQFNGRQKRTRHTPIVLSRMYFVVFRSCWNNSKLSNRILIVGPSSKIDINLDHGADGKKSGDKAGKCSVNFGNVRQYALRCLSNLHGLLQRVYSYASDSKNKTFTGCPLQTVVSNALFSFESNNAKVKLPTGGWLRKDPNADASIYNDSHLEITTTSLSWASTDYVAKTLPFVPFGQRSATLSHRMK